MPDEISDDELRKLLESARASQRSPAPSDEFNQTPLNYDFKRPQLVKKDQTRLIESIHERFVQLFSGTLASSMRMITDVELAFVDQVAYNEFILSLPTPCTAYSFVMEPPGGGAILSFAPDLIMAVIDRAFGGKGQSYSDHSRPLTQIEMNIVKKLVDQIFTDLEAGWEMVSPIQISDIVIEANPEFIQIAAPSDQVVSLAFEAHSNHASGLIHLCYPLHTLDPLLSKFTSPSRQKATSSTDSDRTAPAPPRSLDKVMVPVVIQVARGNLPLEDVAKLQAGNIIKLDTVRNDPAVVFIGNQPKFLGRPGLQGRKRAVEIIRPIDADEEDLYR